MSDLNVTPEQLQQLLLMAQGQQASTNATMPNMMQMPMMQPPQMMPQSQLKLQGVSIPVSVQTPIGKVRTQFILPAEYGANPMMLQQGIQALMMMGYDIDAWQGSSGGNNNGGFHQPRFNKFNNGGGRSW